MISAHSTLTDVAFEVCTCLERAGITAVLTGGSAATVYAPNAYQSRDLDFVVQFTPGHPDPPDPLSRIGFHLVGDYYVHDSNPLILEFPVGPLAIGRDLITIWNTMRDGDQVLHILTPTDCCRDRLAAFLHWNDRGGLAQAVAVARNSAVDRNRIKAWCAREGKPEAFEEFARALAS